MYVILTISSLKSLQEETSLSNTVNFRFMCAPNKDAAKELIRRFDDNLIGIIMRNILMYHEDKDTCYTLDEEAEKLFERITDKYSGQFNLKYSSASQLSSSQPELDTEERVDICVRTKAMELIGCLTCTLWVYCNGNFLIILQINFILDDCIVAITDCLNNNSITISWEYHYLTLYFSF